MAAPVPRAVPNELVLCLYRVTQGVHVATGLASIPLLLAKLWAVYPKLFTWPPFSSVWLSTMKAAPIRMPITVRAP